MAYFLLKTEPSTYSWADLVKAKKATWDGVANPAAVRNIRSARAGDQVAIYHTGDEKAAVGIAEVIIGKQRNGPVGEVELSFIGRYTRFENLAKRGDEY